MRHIQIKIYVRWLATLAAHISWWGLFSLLFPALHGNVIALLPQSSCCLPACLPACYTSNPASHTLARSVNSLSHIMIDPSECLIGWSSVPPLVYQPHLWSSPARTSSVTFSNTISKLVPVFKSGPGSSGSWSIQASWTHVNAGWQKEALMVDVLWEQRSVRSKLAYTDNFRICAVT